mgnify:CR=1 FL=1
MLFEAQRLVEGMRLGAAQVRGEGHLVAALLPADRQRMRHHGAPDAAALSGEYDFITATEVVEHLHRPAFELERLWSLLRPGGWLGIMTSRHDSAQDFLTWHYRNDPSHVIFFSERTFGWLGDEWRTEPRFPAADVALMQKPAVIP